MLTKMTKVLAKGTAIVVVKGAGYAGYTYGAVEAIAKHVKDEILPHYMNDRKKGEME